MNVDLWGSIRSCPRCQFHKYRLSEQDSKVKMVCCGCAYVRSPSCPICKQENSIKPETRMQANGIPYRRAVCDCGYTTTDWNIQTNPKRRKMLRGYVCNQTTSCEGCGRIFEKNDRDEVHHIVPFADGGADAFVNLQRLCLRCHDAAHGKAPRRGA